MLTLYLIIQQELDILIATKKQMNAKNTAICGFQRVAAVKIEKAGIYVANLKKNHRISDHRPMRG